MLFLFPLLLLVIAVSALTIKRVKERSGGNASLESAEPAPIPVRAGRAVSGPIHTLVFGEDNERPAFCWGSDLMVS